MVMRKRPVKSNLFTVVSALAAAYLLAAVGVSVVKSSFPEVPAEGIEEANKGKL